MNTEEFIEKAKKVHGDKYDYSKVDYVNAKTKITIICKEHGEFSQTPTGHLSGRGCPICRYIKSSNAIRKTTEEFIEESKKVHGDKYDYSKSVYNGIHDKLCKIGRAHV